MKKPFTLLVVEDDRISLDLLHSMISVRYPKAITAGDEVTAKQDFAKAGVTVVHCLIKPISYGLLFQPIDAAAAEVY